MHLKKKKEIKKEVMKKEVMAAAAMKMKSNSSSVCAHTFYFV